MIHAHTPITAAQQARYLALHSARMEGREKLLSRDASIPPGAVGCPGLPARRSRESWLLDLVELTGKGLPHIPDFPGHWRSIRAKSRWTVMIEWGQGKRKTLLVRWVDGEYYLVGRAHDTQFPLFAGFRPVDRSLYHRYLARDLWVSRGGWHWIDIDPKTTPPEELWREICFSIQAEHEVWGCSATASRVWYDLGLERGCDPLDHKEDFIEYVQSLRERGTASAFSEYKTPWWDRD